MSLANLPPATCHAPKRLTLYGQGLSPATKVAGRGTSVQHSTDLRQLNTYLDA